MGPRPRVRKVTIGSLAECRREHARLTAQIASSIPRRAPRAIARILARRSATQNTTSTAELHASTDRRRFRRLDSGRPAARRPASSKDHPSWRSATTASDASPEPCASACSSPSPRSSARPERPLSTNAERRHAKSNDGLQMDVRERLSAACTSRTPYIASPERRRRLRAPPPVRDRHPVSVAPPREAQKPRDRSCARIAISAPPPILASIPRSRSSREPVAVAGPPRHPRTRREPLRDVPGRPAVPAQLGRELDRRALSVVEGLVAGVAGVSARFVPARSCPSYKPACRRRRRFGDDCARRRPRYSSIRSGHSSSIAERRPSACSSLRRRFSSDPYATSWISACENHTSSG
jgi:hypothetical protein